MLASSLASSKLPDCCTSVSSIVLPSLCSITSMSASICCCSAGGEVAVQSLRSYQPEWPFGAYALPPSFAFSFSEEGQILGQCLILQHGPGILEMQFLWLNLRDCWSGDPGRLCRLHQHQHLLTMHSSVGVQCLGSSRFAAEMIPFLTQQVVLLRSLLVLHASRRRRQVDPRWHRLSGLLLHHHLMRHFWLDFLR